MDDCKELGVPASFSAKNLSEPKVFMVEMGTDGFNAYAQRDDGSMELFAASTSPGTFVRVMEMIANCRTSGEHLKFSIAGVGGRARY